MAHFELKANDVYDGFMQEKEEQIEKLEEKIISEEDEIKNLERKIEVKEDKILKGHGKVFKLAGGINFLFGGDSKYHAKFIKSGFIKRFNKHKLIYGLTSIVSIVLIWRGVWHLADLTPGISNPIISILLGLFILWFIDRVSELKF